MGFHRRNEFIGSHENIDPFEPYRETRLTNERWYQVIENLIERYEYYLVDSSIDDDVFSRKVDDFGIYIRELDDETLLWMENDGLFVTKELHEKFA